METRPIRDPFGQQQLIPIYYRTDPENHFISRPTRILNYYPCPEIYNTKMLNWLSKLNGCTLTSNIYLF